MHVARLLVLHTWQHIRTKFERGFVKWKNLGFILHEGYFESKDWWNMKGSVKRLRPSDVNTKPYKPGNPSPLRDLVFLRGNPRYIRIDPAHTFAIDGVGKSYYASAIVLLMMVGYFGGGATEVQFRNAYSRFMAFCDANGKSTSIHEFSYKTLKLPIGSFLASIP